MHFNRLTESRQGFEKAFLSIGKCLPMYIFLNHTILEDGTCGNRMENFLFQGVEDVQSYHCDPTRSHPEHSGTSPARTR